MRLTRTTTLPLRMLLTNALLMDQGPIGDVTTQAVINSSSLIEAHMILKANVGIISGLAIAKEIFSIADSTIVFTPSLKDGDIAHKGDVLAILHGRAQGILSAERVALEFVRRMSGIAMKTHAFVKAVEKTGVQILDTRKTMPGYGELDKQAVRDGGGMNHRLNLSTMGLIKNNHIDIRGGNIADAAKRFRSMYPNIPLEIEIRNSNELIQALKEEPDRILLDNMRRSDIRKAVVQRDEYTMRMGKKIPLEASGGMTLTRVRQIAHTGVEYISVGALTHSVQALDISLHIGAA